jgi:hypothetical protein
MAWLTKAKKLVYSLLHSVDFAFCLRPRSRLLSKATSSSGVKRAILLVGFWERLEQLLRQPLSLQPIAQIDRLLLGRLNDVLILLRKIEVMLGE